MVRHSAQWGDKSPARAPFRLSSGGERRLYEEDATIDPLPGVSL